MAACHRRYGGHSICSTARYQATVVDAYHWRRPVRVAAVALANKVARMAWAMMVRPEQFKEPSLLPAAA